MLTMLTCHPWQVCYLCIVAGLWGGCLIGFITEYYTSHSYKVPALADVERSGSEAGSNLRLIDLCITQL